MEHLLASSLILTVLGLVILVLWIFLPLALIGTKPLLRQLIAEVRKTNALLERGISNEAAREAATASPGAGAVPSVWRSGRDAGRFDGLSGS